MNFHKIVLIVAFLGLVAIVATLLALSDDPDPMPCIQLANYFVDLDLDNDTDLLVSGCAIINNAGPMIEDPQQPGPPPVPPVPSSQ